MRWPLLAVFIGCLAWSVSMAPAGTPVVTAATIEPWTTNEREQRALMRARSRGSVGLIDSDDLEPIVETHARAANAASGRAALNFIGWASGLLFLAAMMKGQRKAAPGSPA